MLSFPRIILLIQAGIMIPSNNELQLSINIPPNISNVISYSCKRPILVRSRGDVGVGDYEESSFYRGGGVEGWRFGWRAWCELCSLR